MRFYGFNIDEMRAIEMSKFPILAEEAGNILKMESGVEDKDEPKKEVSLTGMQGVMVAQRLFRKEPRR